MRKYFSILSIIILVVSCSSGEIGNSKDVNPQTIYMAYSVTYTEGEENVECLAQFRFAGEDGTTLVLNNPSSVMLDNKPIVVDSNETAPGAYYVIKMNPAVFAGTHDWVYKDAQGKTYKETFKFTPFKLAEAIPQTISANENLLIKFSGLEEGTNIYCNISDTGVSTNDIAETLVVKDNSISIPASLLNTLDAGPVIISISDTYKNSLKESTPEGGVINYYYGLKTMDATLVKKRVKS